MIEEAILYEDNHLIIINKRCSEIVHSDKTGDISLDQIVKNYIKVKYNKPGEVFLGVVHRIDRPVSGIVIFARTTKALQRLNRMFQEKQIDKTYWAVVKYLPSIAAGSITHYVARNTKTNRTFVCPANRPDAKKAILHYQHVASSDRYHLLEIKLETGRHHQIRCQLAAIGCPIRGDLKYGYSRSNANAGINLHARTVSFKHPVKGITISVTAPLPDDPLWKAFSGGITDEPSTIFAPV